MLKIIDERKVLSKNFRIYGDFENPLFLAKDVAIWIDYGISNVSKMVKTVDEDEKILTRINSTSALFLTEYGLYEVLMQSRKPIAKQFKKEVKHILKEIRRTGKYEQPKQLTLQEKMRYKGNIVLTVKNLASMYGLNEDKILNVIYKLNMHPVLLRGVELSKLKEKYNLAAISNLYVLNFEECVRIIEHLGLKTDNLKSYFEVTANKDISVKMVSKCIELYDELIDMSLEKLYETKRELFTKKQLPTTYK